MVRCPVIINSFNQLTYLTQMVERLNELEIFDLVILDQSSTAPLLLEYLDRLSVRYPVVRLARNHGPHWIFTSGLSQILPDFFAITDPDIYISGQVTSTFVQEMCELARDMAASKIGLALDIGEPDLMRRYEIQINGVTYDSLEWEAQFWREPINLRGYSLYRAPVDTTFAVYNRASFMRDASRARETGKYDCMAAPDSFRIGGTFTSVHLPWDEIRPYAR